MTVHIMSVDVEDRSFLVETDEGYRKVAFEHVDLAEVEIEVDEEFLEPLPSLDE